MLKIADICKFILVTDETKIIDADQYLHHIKLCIQAGVTCVQLRAKKSHVFTFAQKIKKILDQSSIPLIVNDSVSLALDLDAAGVHLGPDDADPKEARAKLGKDAIIGISIYSLADLNQANQLRGIIDYVGVGPIFATKNKADITTTWGLEGLRAACRQTKFPVVAIGGITKSNVSDVVNVGAAGIAAIGAFHQKIYSGGKNLC